MGKYRKIFVALDGSESGSNALAQSLRLNIVEIKPLEKPVKCARFS